MSQDALEAHVALEDLEVGVAYAAPRGGEPPRAGARARRRAAPLGRHLRAGAGGARLRKVGIEIRSPAPRGRRSRPNGQKKRESTSPNTI